MNAVLQEILTTGLVTVPVTGERKPVHSHISSAEGDFLRELVRTENPEVVVEIGLAFGVSALYICDGLEVREKTRYIAIDPAQWLGPWAGVGITNLERASYTNVVQLIEKPSCEALPQLQEDGLLVDFAFIDGWHTFDHALLDFFHLDRILRVGGILVLDDASMPAVRKVCRFIATNRAYSIVGKVGNESAPSWNNYSAPSLKHRMFKGAVSRTRLRRWIRPEILTTDRDLGIDGSCVAFRKIKDDDRRWDHYRMF